MYQNIISSAGLGAIVGLAKWKKYHADKPFDPVKFGKTVGICAIAGGLIGYSGGETSDTAIETMVVGLTAVGIDSIIEDGIKWLMSKINK